MKAIIYISSNPQNTVGLLGYGKDEHEARCAAFARVNAGFNIYDEEYSGGQLIDVAPVLEKLLNSNDDDGIFTFEENGDLAGIEGKVPDIQSILGRLRVYQGKLHTYHPGAGDLDAASTIDAEANK